MTLSLAIDILVATLLVVAISYAVVLNRRLSVLRDDKEKLAELVQGLTVAAQRAEMGVAGLRAAADDIGAQLQKRIEQGHSLREDLTYMIDRGGALADRLDGMIRAKRDAPVAEEPMVRRHSAAEQPLRSEPVLRIDPAALGSLSEDEADTEAARRSGGLASRSERDLQRALNGRR